MDKISRLPRNSAAESRDRHLPKQIWGEQKDLLGRLYFFAENYLLLQTVVFHQNPYFIADPFFLFPMGVNQKNIYMIMEFSQKSASSFPSLTFLQPGKGAVSG